MQIKVFDYGYKELPKRAHYNDAGADVRACFHGDVKAIKLGPGDTEKIPLGIGIAVPDGYMGVIFPRSGLSSKGIVCELPPIDSGYRGEIHAIVHNGSDVSYVIRNDDRIGQLVILPVIMATFVDQLGNERDTSGFGSTGIN